MNKVAKMLRNHRLLVLNRVRTGRTYSSGAGRRIEQQSESDHEKSVRVSILRNLLSCFVSCTWELTEK